LTKHQIAVEEIDRVIASGARFGCVLADSGYGSSAAFRQALSERGLSWAVGLSRRQNVYPADVGLIFPVANTGRRRKYHIPDTAPVAAEAMLADEKWRRVTWRRGSKGLDSGAKCNGFMRSGFERLCQARRGLPGTVF
jgi:SRSO17 transposase